ncbi:MAG: hypothetical protein OXB98_22900 [Bryobacterales bacterium]|nr:hypothetical protein [Bryobacterales bacterium]
MTATWIGKITVNGENGDIRSLDISPGRQSLVVRGALARIDTSTRQIEARGDLPMGVGRSVSGREAP